MGYKSHLHLEGICSRDAVKIRIRWKKKRDKKKVTTVSLMFCGFPFENRLLGFPLSLPLQLTVNQLGL